MTSQADTAALEQAHPAGSDSLTRAPSLLNRLLLFPVKLFWGMIFCQGLTGSILVIGWTYRLAQRSALKLWFSRSAHPQTRQGFVDFLAGQDSTKAHLHWPNWFAQQNFREHARARQDLSSIGYVLSLGRALVQSLWLNLWTGLRAIANTWALTLPAGVLWWFGWYDGWNNSFNKGYEQAAVGPLVSILGIAWFIAAMFYVPIAQARQAVTGDWRAFYQFRLIRTLVRERWLHCVLLAMLYALLSIPLGILKTSPMFWMHNSPALGSLSSSQVLASLKGYFFWCALVMLPAFVIVHLAAARIYASGLLSLVRTGKITESELGPTERDALARLGLLARQPEPERHALVRFVAWTGTRVGRIAGAVVLVLIWFSFVAQIYITEFLNYHAGLGWMNQPLVQLPWFRYLPHSVWSSMGAIFSTLLVLLAAVLIRSVARGLRHLRSP